MSVLSIDLAHKRYEDVGVCSLKVVDDRIEVSPMALAQLGLRGPPTTRDLAAAIADLAGKVEARWVFIDGPQAWKSPDSDLLHSRICERQLWTQGKTGLPGFTKPRNYEPFISFSVELFDRLSDLGWPRLPDEGSLSSTKRFALESFPTSAWRSLNLKPLPGKRKASVQSVQAKLGELAGVQPFSLRETRALTHDELQALVAGLAGVGVAGHPSLAARIAGVAPFELDGFWREGFIVNPIRRP